MTNQNLNKKQNPTRELTSFKAFSRLSRNSPVQLNVRLPLRFDTDYSVWVYSQKVILWLTFNINSNTGQKWWSIFLEIIVGKTENLEFPNKRLTKCKNLWILCRNTVHKCHCIQHKIYLKISLSVLWQPYLGFNQITSAKIQLRIMVSAICWCLRYSGTIVTSYHSFLDISECWQDDSLYNFGTHDLIKFYLRHDNFDEFFTILFDLNIKNFILDAQAEVS